MILTELESLVTEHRALKEANEELRREVRDLARNLAAAEKAARGLRDKLALAERPAALLDGRDEEFLWNNQARIEFTQRLDGGRSVKIKSPSRTLSRVTGGPGEPLLGRAMEDASGRARNRSEDQAASRTSQGS